MQEQVDYLALASGESGKERSTRERRTRLAKRVHPSRDRSILLSLQIIDRGGVCLAGLMQGLILGRHLNEAPRGVIRIDQPRTRHDYAPRAWIVSREPVTKLPAVGKTVMRLIAAFDRQPPPNKVVWNVVLAVPVLLLLSEIVDLLFVVPA